MKLAAEHKLSIDYDYNDVPTVRDFENAPHRIRGIMGPFGSGKSSGCVISLVYRAINQVPGRDGIKRTRWAVIRNTYRQLNDTTIKTFLYWFPPPYFGKYNKSEHNLTITRFKGCEIEILFRALDRPDHVANLLSMELTGAWFNEAREIPWVLIETMDLRINRYPAKADGGATHPGLILDTNPPDEDSDWFKFFEVKQPDNAILFKQPPGLIVKTRPDGSYLVMRQNPLAENTRNLADDYYVTGAKGKGNDFIKVFLLGAYGFSMDGRAVFPEYNDAHHFDADLTVVPRLKIMRGWDFGLTPACVFAQFLPAPRLLLIDELCATHMGIEKFAEEVLIHCNVNYPETAFEDWGDPSGLDPRDTDERTPFEICRSKGIQIRPGIQNLKMRIESTRYGLTNLFQGLPAMLIGPKCKILRKAFMGGYHYRRMRLTIERYEVKPFKNEYSHPMDGVQYICTRTFGKVLTQPLDRSLTPIEQRSPNPEDGAYF